MVFSSLADVQNRKLLPYTSNINTRPAYTFELNNFVFQSYLTSQLSFQIQADRFVIKKKKFGNLSFGLSNEAFFKNAKIQLISSNENTNTSVSIRTNNTTEEAGFHFNDILSNDAFLNLPVKNIFAIKIEDAHLELYSDDTLITAISSARAEVRLHQRDILFSGHVIITSGEKKITCKEASLSPDNSVIFVPGDYELSTPHSYLTGKNFTSSIFLNIKTTSL